jgi:hypothetical protein
VKSDWLVEAGGFLEESGFSVKTVTSVADAFRKDVGFCSGGFQPPRNFLISGWKPLLR